MLKKLTTVEKIQLLLIGVGLFAVLITASVYFLYFFGTISNDQQIWAYFGDYMGGVLNPILSFITIIILILTIGISYRTLDMARGELQHYKNESLKSDLIQVIKETDLEIQQVLKRTADFSSDGKNFGYYFSRSATGASLNNIPIHGKYSFTENDRVTICDLCELIMNLENYLNLYDKTFEPSAITFHYKNKNHNVYGRLTEKGYLFKDGFEAFKNTGYGWAVPIKGPLQKP